MNANALDHVVFIHSSNEMYGSDRMLLRVIDTLPESARQTAEVWLPNDTPPGTARVEDELVARGIRVRLLPLPILRRSALHGTGPISLLFRAAQLLRTLRAARPTAVFCATSATLLAAPAARLAGTRYVFVHVQEIWRRREGLALGALGACCTAGAAISRAAQHSVRGPLARRTRLIENAMEASARPLTELPSSPLRFLIASRWNAWKGHRTLLEAWASVGDGCGVLDILGGPPASGEAVDVPALVSALPNRDTVTIRGELDDVISAIDSAHFVVVPSDDPEPFGLVAIEAFSRGRAVVASDAGGLSDIVTDGVTGKLFPPRRPHALADILRSLDLAQARSLGAAAHSDFTSRYELGRFDAQFRALWTSVAPATDFSTPDHHREEPDRVFH